MRIANLLIIFFLSILFFDVYRFFRDPITLPNNRTEYIMHVTKGSSVTAVIYQLTDLHIIKRPIYLRVYYFFKLSRPVIHAGRYRLTPSMTPLSMMTQMIDGRVAQYIVRLQEGWTFEQIIWSLQRNPHLTHELYGLGPSAVMLRLGYPAGYPEGLFFPDTYFFSEGMTDTTLLKRAYRLMQKKLLTEWEQRDRSVPYQSPYEALIVASLIEKETGVEGERAMIADVILKRLKKGMRLQIDPTVSYGGGDHFTNKVSREDLKKDSSYNTYTRSGLPPTPIAMPGLASIRAALHPDPNPYFYYVSKGNGTHQFSISLEEHYQAVNQYRRQKHEP